MKTRTVTLPAFWASALINNDWSGLITEDAETLKRYLADNPGDAAPVSCSEYPRFYWKHDASGYLMACECLEFNYLEKE